MTVNNPDNIITHSSVKGLSSKEAESNLSKFGYNEIVAKKPNYYLIFLKKFYGPVQLLLFVVIIISYVMGNIENFYIVLALLVFNAVVGFLEEHKADKSVEALRLRLVKMARVLRDGSWTSLQSRLLVPEDVIRIRLGDIVPADATVIDTDSVEIDESVITGESMPVDKKTRDTVYQGSVVKRGEATCIVTGTGYNTKYGKTAKLVEIAKSKSHLEKAVMDIVKYLVAGDLVIVTIMFVYGVFELNLGIGIILPFILVMFIASVPVALSAAFTVSMALGTEKLSKKSILVTKLEAIENTATMGILCADKTGTITRNVITVDSIVPMGCTEIDVLKAAAEASRSEDKDIIDDAVLSLASEKNVVSEKQIKFSPFNPSTKMTSATISGKSTYYVAKGAVPSILEMAKVSSSQYKELNSHVEQMAKEGLRAIAVAKSSDQKKWVVMGLIALHDAPRTDAKKLIKELHAMGIKVKMLTGDNLAVARHVASEVGIGDNVVSMSTLGVMNKAEQAIISADGFANIYPEDKYTIIKALQGDKYVVGMTGDGVNDAPALKQAEVGIAVSNATDVAKEAAALNLTRDGLNVIIDAVKESRRIFERMRIYTMAKIIKVMQIVGFVAITFIAFKFIPITPFLLILLIFTNDIVNISISTDRTGYSQKPDTWRIRSIFYSSAVLGILLILQALVFIPLSFTLLGLSIAQFQSVIFLMFNVTDKMTIFNVRERKSFWKSRPSNALILSSIIGILIGTMLVYFGIFIPRIGIVPILLVFALSTIFMFINDIAKVITFRRFQLS